jgi:hypothetical protein
MTDARMQDRTGDSAASSRAHGVLLSWGPTVLFGMLLPWITYHQLAGHGVHGAPALLLVSIWAALEIGLYFALHHRIDEVGMLMLLALVLEAISAIAYNGGEVSIVRETALTGLVGAALVVSLAFGRPLAFHLGRRFATDGSAAGVTRWSGKWAHDAGFRARQRRLTAVWGVGCLLEAGMVTVLAQGLSTGAVVAVSHAGPVVVTAALAAYTVWTRRSQLSDSQTPAAPSSAPTA